MRLLPAGNSGGAIYQQLSRFNLTEASFTFNSATNLGGALAQNNSIGRLNQTTIANNSAGSGGGIAQNNCSSNLLVNLSTGVASADTAAVACLLHVICMTPAVAATLHLPGHQLGAYA